MKPKTGRLNMLGPIDGHLASGARLETQIWYRVEESRSKKCTYGCRRYRFIGIVDIHNHVFGVIGDIVDVCDNISDDVGTDFLSFCVVVL